MQEEIKLERASRREMREKALQVSRCMAIFAFERFRVAEAAFANADLVFLEYCSPTVGGARAAGRGLAGNELVVDTCRRAG